MEFAGKSRLNYGYCPLSFEEEGAGARFYFEEEETWEIVRRSYRYRILIVTKPRLCRGFRIARVSPIKLVRAFSTVNIDVEIIIVENVFAPAG